MKLTGSLTWDLVLVPLVGKSWPREPQRKWLKQKSITGQYLSGAKSIPVPTERRVGNGRFIEVKGASENNLKMCRSNSHLGN